MRLATFALFLATMLPACKQKPPPEPAALVTCEQLCSDAKYDSYNDPKTALTVQKRVTVEGYLDLPHGTVVLCGYGTCPVSLVRSRGAKDEDFSVSLKTGSDPTQMKELPQKYSQQDLVVHTTDGRTVGVGAKVRVTGRRLGTTNDGSCKLEHKSCQITEVDRIDAL